MDKPRKSYQKPEVLQVSLVPDEAVLQVCKDHTQATQMAPDQGHCSHPKWGDLGVCRGVTGS